jgi:DNA-binding CsgD family transcriptional regulator
MRTGKTDSEIADLLGLPRYMVSSMMANVRRKLAGRRIEMAIEPEGAEER